MFAPTLVVGLAAVCTPPELPLIPSVRKATLTGGSMPPAWRVNRSGLSGFDADLAALHHEGAKISLPLRLEIDANAVPDPEGYRLLIRRQGVRVTGADAAGVFYALKTLRQLVSLYPKGLPCGVVEDSPAFRLRGFMHDTGRNFQSVAMLKAQLDRLADYKINVFHWHLTDRPGWRIECKSYPILNDPSTRLPERDPTATYSYSEIREVIAYAKARHIQVIPELDMPGHSDYFNKAFGFGMGDPRALPTLKELIAEFCREVPARDCPILHIGSDEVRIQEPEKFIAEITAEVRRHGRTPMMWNPGLPNDGSAIDQLWRDWQTGPIPVGNRSGVVDSGLGYINYFDPWELVRRYYFLQTCGVAKGDGTRLGGILCCWPDIRVEDKTKIAAQNGQWPSVLAFAQNSWGGRARQESAAAESLPAPDSRLGREFTEFESRLAIHRDTFFRGEAFPFSRSGHVVWRTIGPFPADTPDSESPLSHIATSYTTGGVELSWKTVHGGVVPVDFMAPIPADAALGRKEGLVPGTAYLLTYVHSPEAATLRAQVGFDTPARSDRLYGGIPPAGTWDSNGGSVFLNDHPVPAPAWKAPGTRRLMTHSWNTAQELVSIVDEELYWTREPAAIPLRAGWNKLLVKFPAGYANHKPKFAFFPVRKDESGRWVEDLSVRFATSPP